MSIESLFKVKQMGIRKFGKITSCHLNTSQNMLTKPKKTVAWGVNKTIINDVQLNVTGSRSKYHSSHNDLA